MRKLAWLCVVSVTAISFVDAARAQSVTRVVAAGSSMTLRNCSERSCDVVAEVPSGQAVEVIKAERGWYRVLAALDGRRMTTGWVEISAVASPPPGSTPVSRRAAMGGGVIAPAPPAAAATPASSEGSDCLACLASRTASADEWNRALAMTSGMKASATLAPPAGAASDSRDRASRVETVRRDGRTAVERMRDDLEERFGGELQRLGELTASIDPALQTYMSTCYDKYLPVSSVITADTLAPSVPSPERPRATVFDIWRGRPFFEWKESWSAASPPFMTAESTALCQGLWDNVNDRASLVKAGIDDVERAAGLADIYPGVVRDALEAHGLAEKK